MKRNRITFLIAELILVAIAGIFINRIFREDNPQNVWQLFFRIPVIPDGKVWLMD